MTDRPGNKPPAPPTAGQGPVGPSRPADPGYGQNAPGRPNAGLPDREHGVDPGYGQNVPGRPDQSLPDPGGLSLTPAERIARAKKIQAWQDAHPGEPLPKELAGDPKATRPPAGTDGSISPHDASSDFNNRQQAAIAQTNAPKAGTEGEEEVPEGEPAPEPK